VTAVHNSTHIGLLSHPWGYLESTDKVHPVGREGRRRGGRQWRWSPIC